MTDSPSSKQVIERLRAVIATHDERGFTSCVVSDSDLRVLLAAADRAAPEPRADAAALLEAYDACWIEDERLCFHQRGPKGAEAKAMREQFNKARAAVLAAMRLVEPRAEHQPELMAVVDRWQDEANAREKAAQKNPSNASAFLYQTEASLIGEILQDVRGAAQPPTADLREAASVFHETYCPTCPDEPCSLGLELRATLTKRASGHQVQDCPGCDECTGPESVPDEKPVSQCQLDGCIETRTIGGRHCIEHEKRATHDSAGRLREDCPLDADGRPVETSGGQLKTCPNCGNEYIGAPEDSRCAPCTPDNFWQKNPVACICRPVGCGDGDTFVPDSRCPVHR